MVSLLVAAIALLVPQRADAQQQRVTPALRQAVSASGGRVIVTMKRQGGGSQLMARGAPPVSANELAQIEERLEVSSLVTPVRRLELVGAIAARVTTAQLEALALDPNVDRIEPDVFMPLLETRDATADVDDRAQTTPWGITRVEASAAWAAIGKGAGVKVGIMDSGGDTNHPDLLWAGGYNVMSGSSSPAQWEDNVGVCNGHGTHVAGTVAARDNTDGVVGVAPDVSLYAIKVFQDVGGTCGAFVSDQIAALTWAVANGIRVVNASLGGGTGIFAYSQAVDNAAVAGTFLVAAAGNSGGAMMYPAAYDGAIAVAALTSSNTRASFSSFGPNMGFAAPGSSILSTMPGGGYDTKSGTSMASPHVTGVVALILAQTPGLSLDGVRGRLQDGALDVGTAGWEEYTGWGLVRAGLSVGVSDPLPTMLVSPVSRRVTVQQGAAAPTDSSTITVFGPGAAALVWAASNVGSWNTVTTPTGLSSGRVRWSRSTAGLAPGTYVDTITITALALGSPLQVVDSLVITPAAGALTLSVTPGSRAASVIQGGAAPNDSATVSLSGTGSTTAPWTATKRKAWTTLTTASGTGSGRARWSRSAAGLAPGVYVDTITVTVAGATGSPDRVYDTLTVTPAAVPLALSVTPGSRTASAQQGTAAPNDSATVTLTGDGSGTAPWTATKRKAWTTLTTASGTGSGRVRWSRNTAGLVPGVYIDTITVTAAGATGSPDRVYDTLTITATPVPLALSVAPGSRSASAQQGTAAPNDSATVTLSGDGASTAPWTAAKRKAWTTLTTASGTGSGRVRWSRSTVGLVPGVYVDTITVTAAGATGSPTRVYDTLTITAAPVPLALAVSPGSRTISAQQGTAAPNDSATVTLTGDGSTTAAWTATKRKTWTTLTTASGTGSGRVRWSRSTVGLVPGTYVDTITVTVAGATGSPDRVYDTLTITAAPPPLTLSVTPGSRLVAAQQGAAAPNDSATVTLTGTGAGTAAWTATKRKTWTTLTTASGTGSGQARWSRSTVGLVPGTYVDTITVTVAGATGSPDRVYDTLTITAAPPPLTLSVTPGSRLITAQQGAAAPNDSATVTLTGTGAGTAAWTATKRKSWTTLTTASGAGSGQVRWSRSTVGLVPGTYVDTITVTAAGATGSPDRVYDTLTITAAPPPLVLAVSPSSRTAAAPENSAAPSDSATVTLTGTGASTAPWTATKRKSWTTLTTASGTGSGHARWSRSTTGLLPGVYVDTITVTVAGATGSPDRVYDTLTITAAAVPLALAFAPGSRQVSVQQGTAAPSDSGAVTLTGDGAASALWTATKRQAWTNLTTASGSGSGRVRWSRSSAGLTPGTYVDTITVTAAGALGSPTRLIDTLTITGAPVALALNVTPLSRSETVSAGHASSLVDSAEVHLSGTGASTAVWSAVKRQSWTTLTVPNGVGSGMVRWSRQPSGLAPGIYVDTITVSAAGATGSPRQIIDSLTVTAAATPLALTVSPSSRYSQYVQRYGVVTDSAVVTLSGDGASTTPWVATRRRVHTSFSLSTGTGSGKVRWARNLSVMAPGTHVDTITVTAGALTAEVYDTVVITPKPRVVLAASGGFNRVIRMASEATQLPTEAVQVQGVEGIQVPSTDWTATKKAAWLSLMTTTGAAPGELRWTYTVSTLAAGRYIDTVVVALTVDAEVNGSYVDTLDVVVVATPAPETAAQQLLQGGNRLSADQRALLDDGGNRNGSYDLGDFLAWVDRNGLHLTASVMQQLQQVSEREVRARQR